jgi:hypothetical protein
MATEEELRAAALKRINERRGFYTHVAIYLIVNAALIGFWWIQGAGYFWPGWVIFGWGIGVAAQGFGVFSGQRPPDEARIQSEMEKMRGASQ